MDPKDLRDKFLLWSKGAILGVGRRSAFVAYSPAKHAVFSVKSLDDGKDYMKKKIYGLKGDMAGGEIAEDENPNNSYYSWVDLDVRLDGHQMTLYWSAAQKEALGMTYDLVRYNCYSPITLALLKVRETTDDGSDQYQTITKMLAGLGWDNFGWGQYKPKPASK